MKITKKELEKLIREQFEIGTNERPTTQFVSSRKKSGAAPFQAKREVTVIQQSFYDSTLGVDEYDIREQLEEVLTGVLDGITRHFGALKVVDGTDRDKAKSLMKQYDFGHKENHFLLFDGELTLTLSLKNREDLVVRYTGSAKKNK